MFSYRHGFHAGNHADVLKHVCQMMIIDKLKMKEKPFIVFDTHSGAGCYDLTSEESKKTGEFEGGIDRLCSSPVSQPELEAYGQLIERYRQKDMYPGSPQISLDLIREQDSLCLMEWHSQEILNLKHNMPQDPRIAIHHRDGYEGLLAMLPPKPSRGIVLIDPPYELAEDYQKVVETLEKAAIKWASGIFALWYPMLAKKRDKSQKMLEKLTSLPFKSLLKIELEVTPQQEELGMHGSGMVIVNPPWQFDTQAEEVLDVLTPVLAQSCRGNCRVEWLIQPQ